jgi:hypothetical protein
MRFVPLLAAFALACGGCARTDPGPDAGPPAGDLDPQSVLEEARDLADQGRYEEALQKYLWFHENALQYDPALSGVRLSFALGYWAELGEVYPKARAALAAVRDRDEQALRAGARSFDRFHDVTAINEHLKERPKTVELFKALRAADPEFAADCYPVAEPDLAAQGEYRLCAAYIPDPLARLSRIEERREMELQFAAEDGPEFREFADRAFAEETCRVIAILVGAGRKPEAETVRDRALAVRDDRPFREALDRALGGRWRPGP